MSNDALCYKSCCDYIVTMKKLSDTVCNESRENVFDPLYAKFRADKLLVVCIKHKKSGKTIDKIQNTSYYEQIWYEVSKKVSVTNYCGDINKICAPGIHYFLSLERALHWDSKPINGSYRRWYDNGAKLENATYTNGDLNGLYQLWYCDGKKREECMYYRGVRHGQFQKWYITGQIQEKTTYVNKQVHGLYESWYIDGNKKQKCMYANGLLNGPYQKWYTNKLKKVESCYVTGMVHGSYKSWHNNGIKRAECTYDSGILVGPCHMWDIDGSATE